MNRRCHGSGRSAEWKHYGGRGIRVCERWRHSFEAFVQDMGERPSPRHSIDRIDVNGNYEPGNMRWVMQREQLANRRNTRFLTVEGVRRPLADWSRESGIDPTAILSRIKSGWDPRRAVTVPARATA